MCAGRALTTRPALTLIGGNRDGEGGHAFTCWQTSPPHLCLTCACSVSAVQASFLSGILSGFGGGGAGKKTSTSDKCIDVSGGGAGEVGEKNGGGGIKAVAVVFLLIPPRVHQMNPHSSLILTLSRLPRRTGCILHSSLHATGPTLHRSTPFPPFRSPV